MVKCKVKKGLFVLSDCKRGAKHQCSQCARAVCERHAVAPDQGRDWLCADCYAKLAQDEDVQDSVYTYRRSYYRSTHFHPIYTGVYYDSYYDEYDLRSFDQDMANQGEFEEDRDADFFDS